MVVHSAPTAADVIFGADLRVLASGAECGWSSGTPTPRACSTSSNSTSWSTTRRARGLGLRARRAARRTRRPLGGSGDRRAPAHRTVPPPGRHRRRGRHGDASRSRTRRRTLPARNPSSTSGEAAGVLMPSGCRMGICFSCVAPLRRAGARPAHRRDATRRRGRPHPDLRLGCGRACDIDL